MVRVYSSDENVNGSTTLSVIPSAILNGWWTDELDNPIHKALLSDIVRFHIETRGIPNERQVEISIMDDDGVFNLDDEITTSSITINSNEGYVEIKLNRTWSHHIDSDGGREIELYAKCRYNGISKEIVNTSDAQLKVYNVGYLVYDDSRIKISTHPNCIGDIEFWPDHFGWLARGQWNQANYPYIYDGKVYTDAQGKQHLGIPKKIRAMRDDYIPFNSQAHSGNVAIRDRDLPRIEDNTPPSPVNSPPTRVQRTKMRKTGGVVKPPVGAKGGAVATLILDVAIMAYDIALPFAVNYENDKINEHYMLLINNVYNDINMAYQSGIIEEGLTYEENCELASVLLYGGDADVSDKIYRIGCDVYEFISNFCKR